MGVRFAVVAFLASALAATSLIAATIGPLPYHDLRDSPFNLSRLGVDFFVEDFSSDLERVERRVGPGAPIRMTKFSTPGVIETTGNATAASGIGELWAPRLGSFGSQTRPLELSFAFDVGELGRWPQAVGFKISNASPLTVDFYGHDGALAESLYTPIVLLPDSLPPSGLGKTIEYYSRFRFLGAVVPGGISRVSIWSPGDGQFLDDFQYGQLVPEPTSVMLMAAAVFAVAARSTRRRRGCASEKVAQVDAARRPVNGPAGFPRWRVPGMNAGARIAEKGS
jgi:hypothetical protein